MGRCSEDRRRKRGIWKGLKPKALRYVLIIEGFQNERGSLIT